MTLVEIDARPALTNGAMPPPEAVVTKAGRRPPLRAYSRELRERVRQLVEGTDRALSDIAEETGVAATTIRNWITRFGWRRPPEAPLLPGPRTVAEQGKALSARLYRALARQLAGIEKRTARNREETFEKDARTLGVLAKALETLTALDRDIGAKKTDDPEPIDRERINAELAEKIERWARNGAPGAAADEEPVA